MLELPEEDNSFTEEELLGARDAHLIRLAKFLKIQKPRVFSKEQLAILIIVKLKYERRD